MLSLTFIALTSSCGVNPTKKMSELTDTLYIGMSLNEFRERIKGEQLVEMNSEVTIYKVGISNYNDLHGWRSDVSFFYFIDNKLYQIDKGEKAIDYRVKIN